MRVLGSLSLVLCLVAPLDARAVRAQQSSTREQLSTRLDSLAKAFASAETGFAGMTAAVVRASDTLLLASYGQRNRDKHLPVDRNTVYRIGTLTMPVTAAAILQHVETGRLRLGDSLGALLPHYAKWRGVTVRQLLNHTSGVPSYTGSKLWDFLNRNEMSREEVLYNIERDPLDFTPGSQFRPSSTEYFLLGMILERVEHKDYLSITAERMFRPLHLRASSYCPLRALNSAYAVGYETVNGKLQTAPEIDVTHLFSWAGVCTSASDYLTWFTAIADGTLLRSATFSRMVTSDSVAGRATGFGLGFNLGELQGHPLVQHAGEVNGFSGVAMWLPKDSIRVVILANTRGVDLSRLANSLAREVLR